MTGHPSPSVALFLGSGASWFAGYETFVTFPDLLLDEEKRKREGLPEMHASTGDFLKEIRSTLAKENLPATHDKFLWRLNDYAGLWNLISRDCVLERRFLKGTTRMGEFALFNKLTQDAIGDITSTTVRHYSRNRLLSDPGIIEQARRVHNLYLALAALNNPECPHLAIFTTNYDMLLEDMVAACPRQHAAPLITGFDEESWEGAAWDCRQYCSNEQIPGLYLHRLHGSVCWFYSGFGDEKIYYHRQTCWEQRHENLCAMYPGREVWRGRNPHANAFRELERAFEICECFVFIGFSFRDDDVMHLLLHANARRATPLRIITLDPAMRAFDVHTNLESAATRTPFPVSIPEMAHIRSLQLKHGISEGFDETLLGEVDDALAKLAETKTMSTQVG